MSLILMLENRALCAVNDYLLTRNIEATVEYSVEVVPYNTSYEDIYKCIDVIAACRGIYGFHAESSHSYVSTFSDGHLLRFKFNNKTLVQLHTVDITSVAKQYPSLGSLSELLDSTDLYTHPRCDALNCYPIYVQFLDIVDSVDNMCNLSESDLVTSYMLISKQRYGITTKLKIVKNVEQITDLRELVALFRGLYVVNDCLYARVLSKDNKTVLIVGLRWEN